MDKLRAVIHLAANALRRSDRQAHFEIREELLNVGGEALGEIEQLKQRIAELEAQVPPSEKGTNRYGVDVAYFRNAINRELNRPLVDYRPDELARVLARLAKTADKKVLLEDEFCSALIGIRIAQLELALKRIVEAYGYAYIGTTAAATMADIAYQALNREEGW